MSIITQAMIESRIGAAELIRLTDDSGDEPGAVDGTVLAASIAEAEGELLGFLGQVYQVPLTLSDASTGNLVKAKLLDVVVYRLYLRRERSASDEVSKQYRAAIEWATKVAEGKLGLAGETGVSASPTPGGKIRVNAGTCVFGRENMAGL